MDHIQHGPPRTHDSGTVHGSCCWLKEGQTNLDVPDDFALLLPALGGQAHFGHLPVGLLIAFDRLGVVRIRPYVALDAAPLVAIGDTELGRVVTLALGDAVGFPVGLVGGRFLLRSSLFAHR